MTSPAILKIVLAAGTGQRLTFPDGLPEKIEDLVSAIKAQCGVNATFKLQFMDPLFGNEFMNLTSMEEIYDRGTIRMVAETLTCMDASSPSMPSAAQVVILQPSAARSMVFQPLSPNPSVSSADTEVLSSADSEPSGSRSLWPPTFHCPMFSYDTELKLQEGNAAFKVKGRFLCADSDPKMKSDILHGLTEEIVKYGVYATDKQFSIVGKALISKHPCLAEEHSFTGFSGWKTSLKNKLALYRSRLRKLGCPEVMINAVPWQFNGIKTSPALGIKKPKRSEVNYCPAYPTGEDDLSLEKLRVELASDVQRKAVREMRSKMDKTFAYRRQEIIRRAPMIHEVQQRWPALFDVQEINAEFKRITTTPLQSRFLSQLDIISDKLVKLFTRRAGQVGTHLKTVMSPITQDGHADDDDVDVGRECLLKGLCIYLNEDPSHLIRELVEDDDGQIQKAVEETTVGILSVKRRIAERPDIRIILEGHQVLVEIDNVALATSLLFGLMYALNVDYPKDFKYTFEFLQKVVMELEGTTMSKKCQALQNKLRE